MAQVRRETTIEEGILTVATALAYDKAMKIYNNLKNMKNMIIIRKQRNNILISELRRKIKELEHENYMLTEQENTLWSLERGMYE